ncbi:translation initiation factor IF-2 [Candidatus Peregrinibacteria bacterium]|nr:translation initiation factor IF-2 [Candidatus Peregrinibacteria bacterium]
MRLVQVAKALGMSGQDLRHELGLVDFGVKPSDREIPDNLAQGVARYLARKHKLTVDFSIFGGEGIGESPTVSTDHVKEAPSSERPSEAAPAKEIHILRKLTLDDVPRSRIAPSPKPKAKLSKEEQEELLREKRAQTLLAKKQAENIPQEQIKKKEGSVILPVQITVKEFSEKAGVQIPLVIQVLMKNGIMATVNQSIDYDTAAIIAADLGVTVEREESGVKVEDIFSRNLEELIKDDAENLTERSPIVVVMGHVDHGKTAILDAIRETDVVKGEAGGITQHIGAYQVEHDGKRITFLDTPGHEAFTAMRARGAQVTDIAVIVVSAEEGVKATTIEAINHAKDAEVPIIVAINKIDKPNADIDRVKGEIASQGLQPEEWGGKTPVVLCSALTKQGIKDLLDHILLVAELHGFKANPNRRAIATVIESHLDASMGALATVIVNTGTLRVGDAFVCGGTAGKIRAMMDARGGRLDSVLPSGAVRVSGFQGIPDVGDILQVLSSEREAKELLKELVERRQSQKKRSFIDLVSRLSEGKVLQLKVVLKADTFGSLEAIRMALERQATSETSAKVIHSALGAVSESDVMMAAASDGVVIAFNVPVPTGVRETADHEGVSIREYDIIYKLLEEVGELLQGLLEPEELDRVVGHLDVKGVFYSHKNEQVVGGKVLDGLIKRVLFKVMREGKEVGTGRITSLKHVEKDIKEAKEGSECGMRVETNTPIIIGDTLEVFAKEFKKKK